MPFGLHEEDSETDEEAWQDLTDKQKSFLNEGTEHSSLPYFFIKDVDHCKDHLSHNHAYNHHKKEHIHLEIYQTRTYTQVYKSVVLTIVLLHDMSQDAQNNYVGSYDDQVNHDVGVVRKQVDGQVKSGVVLYLGCRAINHREHENYYKSINHDQRDVNSIPQQDSLTFLH